MKTHIEPLRGLLTAALALAVGSYAPAAPGQPLDCSSKPPGAALVEGCGQPPTSGEIGFDTAYSENGNGTVTIEVPIVTNTAISTFTFDLQFPSNLLRYDTTLRGDLTTGFFLFGGEPQPSGDVIRVVGVVSSANPIPAGRTGSLASLRFDVLQSGCGEFAMVGMGGHLLTYDVCATGTSSSAASFDVRPGACPNRVLVGLTGTVTTAVLGTATLDAARVDPTSVRLTGPGGTISPVGWFADEVGSPAVAGCECGGAPDGRMDYVLKFGKLDLTTALGPVSTGDVVPVEISGTADGVPFQGTDCVLVRKITRFTLAVVPFSPPRAILELEEPGRVRVKAFDITGRLVDTLLDGTKPAGRHEIEWDTTRHASGIYFLRYEGDAEVETRKVVVVR